MGWTRNFKNIYVNKFIKEISNASGTPTTTDKEAYVFDDTRHDVIKMHDGTLVGLRCGSYYNYINTYLNETVKLDFLSYPISSINNSSLIYVAIALGTNDAEESIDDYTISIVNTVSQVGNVVSSAYLGENGQLEINYKLCVQSTSDVEIKELGLLVREITPINSSYGNSFQVLLYRKKFDTPISLTAGVPVNINFSISIPNPVEEY